MFPESHSSSPCYYWHTIASVYNYWDLKQNNTIPAIDIPTSRGVLAVSLRADSSTGVSIRR